MKRIYWMIMIVWMISGIIVNAQIQTQSSEMKSILERLQELEQWREKLETAAPKYRIIFTDRDRSGIDNIIIKAGRGSLYLNGYNYLEALNTKHLNLKENFEIEFYVNFASLPDDAEIMLIGKDIQADQCTGGWGIFYDTYGNDDLWSFVLRHTDTDRTTFAIYTHPENDTITATINRWYHVVCKHNPTTQKIELWVDGKKQCEGVNTKWESFENTPLTIGKGEGYVGKETHLYGHVDELIIKTPDACIKLDFDDLLK